MLDGMVSQTVSVIKIYLYSRVIQIPCLKWSSSWRSNFSRTETYLITHRFLGYLFDVHTDMMTNVMWLLITSSITGLGSRSRLTKTVEMIQAERERGEGEENVRGMFSLWGDGYCLLRPVSESFIYFSTYLILIVTILLWSHYLFIMRLCTAPRSWSGLCSHVTCYGSSHSVVFYSMTSSSSRLCGSLN